jgi:hypothetical protein
MKPCYIPTIIVCILLCGLVRTQAQDMDKELANLATKLATLTKENSKKKVTVLDFMDPQGGASEHQRDRFQEGF